MRSPENTSGKPLTPSHLDEFGGRPPDGVPEIPTVIHLERPSSPTLLEGQSVMKKVRSCVDVEENSDGVDMDADHVSVADGNMREGDVRRPAGDGTTYASIEVVGQHSGSRSGVLSSENLMEDRDTVIGAENRGDSVMAGADGNMGNMRARVTQSQMEGHVADATVDLGVTGGNVIRNAAYMVSNPDKRKKKVTAKPLKSVEVIPTMNGSKSTVVTHHPIVRSGSHLALRIVEDLNTGITPARKEVAARQGIRVKKSSNSGKGGLGVVDWVKSAHARIDAMGNQRNGKLDGNSNTMDNLSDDHLLSEEDLWEEDNLANMSDVGEENDVGVGNDQSAFIIACVHGLNIKQWVRDNLTKRFRFGRDPRGWDLIFGATCWYLWLYRNGVVFGSDGIDSWSVLAKVREWYVEHVAGLQQVSFAAGSDSIGSHRVVRDDHGSWNPLP
ncbi:hypothetical protein V6N12_034242 [Hibiscus sabdariffa]|uniref:Uncharacterized protein n=1 Tax=Hibiscus sabdariffa TaxID=183260 RepID=A0ABR2BJ19_9ROSI